jgi:hypothetical protein
MNKVWKGDDWKSADTGPEKPKPRTRLEEMHYIDMEYAYGRIDREEWSRRFDELGDPRLWNAAGRVVRATPPPLPKAEGKDAPLSPPERK